MQVNILEAKNRLSQLIKSAQTGEKVIIANRGEPVARTVPVAPVATKEKGSARVILGYLAECHVRWGAVVKSNDAPRRFELAISPLVKCECLVGPIKRGDPVAERSYSEWFETFTVLAMPEGLPASRRNPRPVRSKNPRRASSGLRAAPWLRRFVDE